MTTALLSRERSSRYNCANLATEAWYGETGQDIACLLGVTTGVPDLAARRLLQRVAKPVSPCIVLFQRGRIEVHVGVFARGRVLHLSEVGPVRQLLPIASLGYTSVRFYAPRPPNH
jgi:hypothetical protein